eukprot:114408-Amphidinium_carterae.1
MNTLLKPSTTWCLHASSHDASFIMVAAVELAHEHDVCNLPLTIKHPTNTDVLDRASHHNATRPAQTLEQESSAFIPASMPSRFPMSALGGICPPSSWTAGHLPPT